MNKCGIIGKWKNKGGKNMSADDICKIIECSWYFIVGTVAFIILIKVVLKEFER